MRVLYNFYVLKIRNFEQGNRKDRSGSAMFQAMLLKFRKTFSEVEVLVKCKINVTNRIYELQERLNMCIQITGKYICEGTEPGKI